MAKGGIRYGCLTAKRMSIREEVKVIDRMCTVYSVSGATWAKVKRANKWCKCFAYFVRVDI